MKLKSIKNRIKNSLKWIHLSLICALLYVLSDHILEALIVLILMYEIGFEFSAIDKLMDYNNQMRRWMLRKFSSRKAKKLNQSIPQK